MECLRHVRDIRVCLIIILSILCLSELLLFVSRTDVDDGVVNLNDTKCFYSENIGRRIFIHVCEIDDRRVFDIRYFWHREDEYLKPERIGVQLTQLEFDRLCAVCSNYVIRAR